MTQSTALAQAKAGGLVAFTARNNPFVNAANAAGASDGLFLRMNGKTGVWVSNHPDMPEFAPGTELAFDLYNAEASWLGFDKNNKPYRGPKVKIVTGAALPEPPTPGTQGIPLDVKWNKQVLIKVALTDSGKELLLSASAKWGASAVWKLLRQYGDKLPRFPDPTSKTGYMTPIVRIDALQVNKKSKKEGVVIDPVTGHKSIGEVEENVQFYSEVYEIVDWITQAEMENQLAAQGEAPDASDVGSDGASQIAAPAATGALGAGAPALSQPAAAAKVVTEGEIIPPAAQAGAQSGFRRNRAGVRS